MQSIIQYRTLGKLVEEERRKHGRNVERTRDRQDGERSSSSALSSSSSELEVDGVGDDSEKDIEKADHEREHRTGGEPSSELPDGVQVMNKGDLLDLGDMQEPPVEPKETQERPQTLHGPASHTDDHVPSHHGGLSATTTRTDGAALGQKVFIVGFQGEHDPSNPHNWGFWKRAFCTLMIAAIGFIVGFASSIDSSALQHAAEEFGVSEVVESLATGLYLVGFGCGALIAGPFSETFGRNPVYIITLGLFMIFIMASGLAPNIGAQLVFRFLAGVFGATPLVCAGGSLSDLWDPMERVFAFPIFANAAFSGPIVGPVLGGYIASSSVLGTWRWCEWITLIWSGVIFVFVALFQPETYPSTLLQWRAQHLRRVTGDTRFRAKNEIRSQTFMQRLGVALYRPFLITIFEPIVVLLTIYLTVIYIVLFTFLDGYTYIFAEIHGTSEGVTGLCFLGILVGLCLASALVPIIYHWAQRDLKKIKEQGGDRLPPEFRLWFAMLGGAVAIPVSLFWMGWTSYSSISIWSPLAASVLFGYGILCVFISCYQYIIDSYEMYSASALVSATLVRYCVSGGMVVVGIPFYENVGVHWTLTILGGIATACVPFPYVFYFYGPKIRARSRYAPKS